ncbi:MAG: hypothetical protein M1820_005607 [Bogoriella megaspora]|nr:MAG: hypothetical protein M1820_005607 [Bogoriella megaspora]
MATLPVSTENEKKRKRVSQGPSATEEQFLKRPKNDKVSPKRPQNGVNGETSANSEARTVEVNGIEHDLSREKRKENGSGNVKKSLKKQKYHSHNEEEAGGKDDTTPTTNSANGLAQPSHDDSDDKNLNREEPVEGSVSRKKQENQYFKTRRSLQLIAPHRKFPPSSTAERSSQSKANTALSSEKPRKKRNKNNVRRKQQQRERANRNARPRPAWNMTEPLGGHFIQYDPVFSTDERHILLGHRRAVHVYDVSTSMLVRTLPVGRDTEVSAFSLSATNKDQLYLATKDGSIFLWDWVSGTRIGGWEFQSQITGLWTTSESVNEDETVFTIDKNNQTGRYVASAHKLRLGSDANKITSITLFEPRRFIQSLQVLPGGKNIIVGLENSFAVGMLKDQANDVFKDKVYIWHEIDCVDTITCFDSRTITSPKQAQNKSGQSIMDVAVGTAGGPIFVYHDLLEKMINGEPKEHAPLKKSLLAPQRFHWHREAVGSVKWSLDGNYLISGGRETVLVLWQLETSKKQFLPHLTSEIESIVVSPLGASYSIRLADNSLIVLSTSELKAKTHVAGIQTQAFPTERVIPTVPDTLTSRSRGSIDPLDVVTHTPAVFSPEASHQLLLAVPTSQARIGFASLQMPTSHLQTFDVSSGHHVARQALTRNNATNINVGPEGIKLDDPNVEHLCISCDGKWLATTEEWEPPLPDVEYLASHPREAAEEQSRRREIYLKFWRWNEKDATWMLETRVDLPHQLSDGCSAHITDLAADPVALSFATSGKDGIVRVWRPHTTFPSNRILKGVHANGIINWSCSFVCNLQSDQNSMQAQSGQNFNARLAYSLDGSVLAACRSPGPGATESVVHIIEASSGGLAYIRALPTVGKILGVGFLEPYLVLLSDRLVIWDPVEDAIVFGFDLDLYHLTFPQRTKLCHLATNAVDNTFAIAIPVPAIGSQKRQIQNNQNKKSDVSTRVFVFEATNPEPIFTTTLSQLPTSLIVGPESKGFALLDAGAEIRMLNSISNFATPIPQPLADANASLTTLQVEPGDTTSASNLLGRLLGIGRESSDKPKKLVRATPQDAETGDVEHEKVVRPERLAEILDTKAASGGGMQVMDMFHAVVGLFARASRNGAETGRVT